MVYLLGQKNNIHNKGDIKLTVIEEGHFYELANFDKPEERGQYIQFIKKSMVHNGNPESAELVFKTVRDGTTNEEVLGMLIDRLFHLNKKAPCRENSIVITKLQEALFWLNYRTQLRKSQKVEGTPANHSSDNY